MQAILTIRLESDETSERRHGAPRYVGTLCTWPFHCHASRCNRYMTSAQVMRRCSEIRPVKIA
jgi:hypothetical protein